jgi:hypothetical protein
MKKSKLSCFCLVGMQVASAFMRAAEPAPELAPSSLPRILLIGDSISIGYTPCVAESLKGEAIVEHNPGNARHTGYGLEQLEPWLAGAKWDVIHFNWGLWDLSYNHPEPEPQGTRDKINGTVTTPLERYTVNLDRLVIRLKATGAQLIWAHTTVVPEGEPGRFAGDERRYNEVAARVMARHGVPINDLGALTAGFPPELFTKPGNVHYTAEGYRRIGAQVADVILAALAGEVVAAAGAPAGKLHVYTDVDDWVTDCIFMQREIDMFSPMVAEQLGRYRTTVPCKQVHAVAVGFADFWKYKSLEDINLEAMELLSSLGNPVLDPENCVNLRVDSIEVVNASMMVSDPYLRIAWYMVNTYSCWGKGQRTGLPLQFSLVYVPGYGFARPCEGL